MISYIIFTIAGWIILLISLHHLEAKEFTGVETLIGLLSAGVCFTFALINKYLEFKFDDNPD